MILAQRMLRMTLPAFIAGTLACGCVAAQEVHAAPGQFDYYVLNLTWAPEFCETVRNLPENRRGDTQAECGVPNGFVLHGLWPQNFDGTWPSFCSNRPGPAQPEKNLDMTPSLALLQHEWARHGTCTTLSPEIFFATAREAYNLVNIPGRFQDLDHGFSATPDSILRLFQAANPTFPQGSFVLSCGRNRLTAVEACFSKDIQPIACRQLPECHANQIKVEAEDDSGIVQ